MGRACQGPVGRTKQAVVPWPRRSGSPGHSGSGKIKVGATLLPGPAPQAPSEPSSALSAPPNIPNSPTSQASPAASGSLTLPCSHTCYNAVPFTSNNPPGQNPSHPGSVPLGHRALPGWPPRPGLFNSRSPFPCKVSPQTSSGSWLLPESRMKVTPGAQAASRLRSTTLP